MEVTVRIAPTMNSFLLSYDVNEFIDFVDDLRSGNPPCNWPAAVFLESALSMIPSRTIKAPLRVSIGTQTEINNSGSTINSVAVFEQSITIDDSRQNALVASYGIEIGENTEIVSSTDSESFHASDTWRDSSDMILLQ